MIDKEFIIDQYNDNSRLMEKDVIKRTYLLKKNNNNQKKIFLISIKSSDFSCGDEVDALIWKEEKKRKIKINFSNDNCCITTGAAINLVSSYMEKNGFFSNELKELVFNMKNALNEKKYKEEKIKDLKLFFNSEGFYNRKGCIKIAIDFIEEVFCR